MSGWRGEPVIGPTFAEWFGKPYADPFHAGAAVAFGLMGMGRAIHLRTVLRGRVCSCCGGRDDFLLCGPCQHAVKP